MCLSHCVRVLDHETRLSTGHIWHLLGERDINCTLDFVTHETHSAIKKPCDKKAVQKYAIFIHILASVSPHRGLLKAELDEDIAVSVDSTEKGWPRLWSRYTSPSGTSYILTGRYQISTPLLTLQQVLSLFLCEAWLKMNLVTSDGCVSYDHLQNLPCLATA